MAWISRAGRLPWAAPRNNASQIVATVADVATISHAEISHLVAYEPTSIRRMWGIRYQVTDVERVVQVYTQVLGFHVIARVIHITPSSSVVMIDPIAKSTKGFHPVGVNNEQADTPEAR